MRLLSVNIDRKWKQYFLSDSKLTVRGRKSYTYHLLNSSIRMVSCCWDQIQSLWKIETQKGQNTHSHTVDLKCLVSDLLHGLETHRMKMNIGLTILEGYGGRHSQTNTRWLKYYSYGSFEITGNISGDKKINLNKKISKKLDDHLYKTIMQSCRLYDNILRICRYFRLWNLKIN